MFFHRAFVCGTGVVGGGGTADLGDGADEYVRGILGAGVGIGFGAGVGAGVGFGTGFGTGGGVGDAPADDGTGGGLGLVNSSIIVFVGVVSNIAGVSWSDDTLSVRNKASCIPPAPAASDFRRLSFLRTKTTTTSTTTGRTTAALALLHMITF